MSRWLAPPASLVLYCLLGLLQSLIWIALAVYLERPCAWMALVLGLTAALVLRSGRMPPGVARMLWAALLTAIAIAWANWGIVAVQMGVSMGVPPQESATKLGWQLALTLFELATGTWDRLVMLVAVLGAAWLAR